MEWILTASILWGVTTPFIRRGAQVTFVHSDPTYLNRALGALGQIKSLLTQWQYVVPLLLNMGGSLAFARALQRTDLALVSPITNSLSLAFTWIVGLFLGEQVTELRSVVGVLCVVIGSFLCGSS